MKLICLIIPGIFHVQSRQMADIILRPWQRRDAEALAQIANDRAIWDNVRDQLPHPYTLSDAVQWINHCQAQETPVNFAIEYKGKVAGSIGCVPQQDVYRKNMEIGYFVGEMYKGRGIATEAVRVLESYILSRFDVVRIYAKVFAHNTPSMKVLHKNGFFLESIHRKAAIKNNTLVDEHQWVKFVSA